jgi:hypothetical protein
MARKKTNSPTPNLTVIRGSGPPATKTVSAKPYDKDLFDGYDDGKHGQAGLDWLDEQQGYYSKKYRSVPLWPGTSAIGGGTTKYTPSCYESHKPMPLPGGFFINGGSCIHPAVLDADIYVGLDGGFAPSSKAYPWLAKPTVEFLYKISDYTAPKDNVSFAHLIAYLVEQIKAGKKVHVGCIGGHGRTGTVLAAVYATMGDDKDAITYVRANYCKKAVESESQINFLAKHFGIKKVGGSKIYKPAAKQAYADATSLWTDGKYTGANAASGSLAAIKKALPVKSAACVWGPNAIRR